MRTLSTAVLASALGLMSATSAQAVLIDNGITYTLTETSTADPTVKQFKLDITGINGAADAAAQGAGRTGVNAIAFNPPPGFQSAVMLIPNTGFTVANGGLSSTGCDGSGNFFCFDNTAIFYDNDPQTPDILPTTVLPTNSSLSFTFNVDAAIAADFAGYNPSFKIDWTGLITSGNNAGEQRHNYSLVSMPIGITDGPNPPPPPPPPPNPVPEPGSLLILGTALAGWWAVRRRRHFKNLA